MRFTSTTASLLATLPLATSRLIGISAPATISPSTTYNLTLLSENYIQSISDVAFSLGYSTSPSYPGVLGYNVVSHFLGPDLSNQGNKSVVIEVEAPAREDLIPGRPEGPGEGEKLLLNVAVFSLLGALKTPFVANYNVSVGFGEEGGSGEVVSSTEAISITFE
ncbi:secreted nis1 [Pyrenophora seminiperda CCB06]|uniref:Secreted nis1 n=1 Tax=Pyrenophora seminiperda CCB06 TaxID=1302712 RepID=A0A3M7M1Y3_9PLEO|nr:secreted nis1 [Pyrenophora seminiperda CCB06]